MQPKTLYDKIWESHIVIPETDAPAILFVDGRQTNLIKSAQLAPHRVLLAAPLKVRELREGLVKLLRPEGNEEAVAQPT